MGRKYPTDISGAEAGVVISGVFSSCRSGNPCCSLIPLIRDEELEAYRKHVAVSERNGQYGHQHSEVGGSLHFDPRRTPNEKEVLRLDEAGWQSLAEGLNACGSYRAGIRSEADVSPSWRNGC